MGLDPEQDKLPQGTSQFEFNKNIIDQTHDLVCAYKPNIAFYEGAGIEGLQSLRDTINYLKKQYPEIPIILDAKRADIGNTAKMYAKWRASVPDPTANDLLGLENFSVQIASNSSTLVP